MAKLGFFGLVFLAVWDVSARPNPSKIQSSLNTHSSKLLSLQKEILRMEGRLGKTNRRYLNVLKKKKGIDEAIYAQKKGLGKNLSEIKKKMERVNHMVRLTVVNVMGEQEDGPGGMLYKKIVLKSLKKELADLKSQKKRNRALVRKLMSLERRYKENVETEKQLASLMQEWEYAKREKIDSYIVHAKQAARLKRHYKKMKKDMVAKALFKSPLDDYASFQQGKKGVTYQVERKRAVKSTRGGKVVYSGKLSTYGNVVMLDHGNEVRSVILGKFTPGVSKGVVVKIGETLGYTNEKGGKIYFEVRKKNKAQDTMALIDKGTKKI